MRGFRSILGATALVLTTGAAHAGSASFDVLYSFLDEQDGGTPLSSLTRDSAGNLYGTTQEGGTSNNGVVYRIAPDSTETALYAFSGGSDGRKPEAGVVIDTAGNFYGTTFFGGPADQGTVYRLAPDGTETVLHAFGGNDGSDPFANLVRDKHGNLYGTTSNGGAHGQGTIFEITAGGAFKLLYAFTGGADGGFPQAGLLEDKAGNFYGTASGGGAGFGTVYRLDARGRLATLYTFTGGSDGAYPLSALIGDAAGNLYGTTRDGGKPGCPAGTGCGTVFVLAPNGTEHVLYAFTGGSDGGEPYAGLVRDAAGNFYGTTIAGGSANGYGTVFKIAAGGGETTLHIFQGPSDGEYPNTSLIADAHGHLYGTTYAGGPQAWGTVFKMKE